MQPVISEAVFKVRYASYPEVMRFCALNSWGEPALLHYCQLKQAVRVKYRIEAEVMRFILRGKVWPRRS